MSIANNTLLSIREIAKLAQVSYTQVISWLQDNGRWPANASYVDWTVSQSDIDAMTTRFGAQTF